MKTYKTPAIILKRYKIGEADRLVLALTKELGKISFIAKSVRKLNSKLAGYIEPYRLTDLELMENQSRYYKLVGAYHFNPKVNYQHTSFKHLEILGETIDLTLGDNEANPEAFEILVQGLASLQTNQANSHLITIETLVKLLSTLGFRPELKNCVYCQNPVDREPVGFSSPEGGLVCFRCLDRSNQIQSVKNLKTITLLRLMQNEKNLANRIKIKSEYLDESSQLIFNYLLTHLPRPLKSLSI